MRNTLQHKISHFTHRPWGARKARCRGHARILTDILTRASVINLARLATLWTSPKTVEACAPRRGGWPGRSAARPGLSAGPWRAAGRLHGGIRFRNLDSRVTLIERCREAGHVTHRHVAGLTSVRPLPRYTTEREGIMASICWIRLTSKSERLQPPWAKLRDVVDPSLRVDIAVEQRFLAKSRNFTRSLYAEHLNSVHMIEAASHAQADGFDGVFPGCWNDPLWEAREVLDIPLASVDEQSTLATPQPVGDGSSASNTMRSSHARNAQEVRSGVQGGCGPHRPGDR